MEIIDHIRNLPRLEPSAIHIWGVHVPSMLDRLDALKALLNDREREKAARFRREADRHSSIAARGALRVLLSGYAGLSPSEIEFTYSENGKPRTAETNVAFNVSHSGEWVVIAIGRDRAIGVDIEQIKRDMDVLSIAGRYYAPDERAAIEESEDSHATFFQLWARKEAYVKACGSTLFTELKRISVPLVDGAVKDGWFFHYLEAGSKYAAAVVTDKPLGHMPCYDFGGLNWEDEA